MTTNYVLIDFENVQPTNLELLQQHPFKVFVFVGATQKSVPYELASAMQGLGASGQYVKITGSGKNALDFHIAYYLGQLICKDPQGYFHVISKDTGFDQLIEHLTSMNIKVQRERDLAEIPLLRVSTASTNEEKITAIVKNLTGRGQSRPRKVKTLSNTIDSLFREKLSNDQLSGIIQQLRDKKYITIRNENISYHLPSR